MAVDGPAKPTVTCHDNKDGTVSVTWVPPAAGEYHIHIKTGGKEIVNSPFVARVAGISLLVSYFLIAQIQVKT